MSSLWLHPIKSSYYHRLIIAASLISILALGAGCTKPRPSKLQTVEKHKPKAAQPQPAPTLKGGQLIFSDDFEREAPGETWLATGSGWRIEGGWLLGQKTRNKGFWLNQELPKRTRIEFDARSTSAEGDIKFEIFAVKPQHQGGYIAILGGWKNTLSIIARKDEHGNDRLTTTKKLVEIDKTYHMAVVRTDDNLSWFIDGELFLTYKDPKPIPGRYFGFNNWESSVSFDNMRVYKL